MKICMFQDIKKIMINYFNCFFEKQLRYLESNRKKIAMPSSLSTFTQNSICSMIKSIPIIDDCEIEKSCLSKWHFVKFKRQNSKFIYSANYNKKFNVIFDVLLFNYPSKLLERFPVNDKIFRN